MRKGGQDIDDGSRKGGLEAVLVAADHGFAAGDRAALTVVLFLSQIAVIVDVTLDIRLGNLREEMELDAGRRPDVGGNNVFSARIGRVVAALELALHQRVVGLLGLVIGDRGGDLGLCLQRATAATIEAGDDEATVLGFELDAVLFVSTVLGGEKADRFVHAAAPVVDELQEPSYAAGIGISE